MDVLFYGRSSCDKKSCRMTGFGFLSTLWVMIAFTFHGLGTSLILINNNYLKWDYQNRFNRVLFFNTNTVYCMFFESGVFY